MRYVRAANPLYPKTKQTGRYYTAEKTKDYRD
jgi:hypothetical protein